MKINKVQLEKALEPIVKKLLLKLINESKTISEGLNIPQRSEVSHSQQFVARQNPIKKKLKISDDPMLNEAILSARGDDGILQGFGIDGGGYNPQYNPANGSGNSMDFSAFIEAEEKEAISRNQVRGPKRGL